MVTREGVRFQVKRITGLFKLLFRNKMSLLGLVLLVIFALTATFAPLLTPYHASDTVAAPYAQPEWVMGSPDGYYLSKNVIVGTDHSFMSPASLGTEWNVSSPNGPLNTLPIHVSYDPAFTAPGDPGGSLLVVNRGSTRLSAIISETFKFTYNGPPGRFGIDFAVFTPNSTQYNGPVTNSTSPVHIRVFIAKSSDGQVFNVYDRNDTVAGAWVPTGLAPLDSASKSDIDSVRATLGIKSTLDPAAIIFATKAGTYTYGVEVTLGPGETAHVDHLRIKLYGTAWGIFGTDYQGTDVYTQLVYGSRVSLAVGLSAAGIGIGLGLLVGLMAGFLGKFVDEVLMRFTDMMLVIPGLPLLIVLVGVLGQNIYNVVIIIGFLGWMGFARIVRSQVLSLRERPFIEAAKASGAGAGRIIYKHVFPNIVSLTYVNLALAVPGAILTEAALAFLGLSDPAVTSWGNMFSNINQSLALSHVPPPWWWILPPGFSIALVSLSFVLIGYALDEIFNPKLRQRR